MEVATTMELSQPVVSPDENSLFDFVTADFFILIYNYCFDAKSKINLKFTCKQLENALNGIPLEDVMIQNLSKLKNHKKGSWKINNIILHSDFPRDDICYLFQVLINDFPNDLLKIQYLRKNSNDEEYYDDINSLFFNNENDNSKNNSGLTIVELKSLQNLTSLTSLKTKYSISIFGNVNSLCNLINLQQLNLRCDFLTGNFSFLKCLIKLKYLKLHLLYDHANHRNEKNEKISDDDDGDELIFGDIDSLSAMTDLEDCSILIPKMNGNLSSISNLTNLKCFDLGLFNNNSNSSELTGDILSLSNLHSLRILNLRGRHDIFGEISTLNQLTNLFQLDLTNIKVSGNIKDLSHSRKNTFKFVGSFVEMEPLAV